MITQVHTEDELSNLINTHPSLLVIDAFALWCGPCRTLAPELEIMSTKYPNVLIVKVDVDELPYFTDKYNITVMPTIMFVKSNRIIAQIEGANISLIERYIQNNM